MNFFVCIYSKIWGNFNVFTTLPCQTTYVPFPHQECYFLKILGGGGGGGRKEGIEIRVEGTKERKGKERGEGGEVEGWEKMK